MGLSLGPTLANILIGYHESNAGPSGKPIATPSVCLFIVSLKLNSTDDVALSISSINTAWGMGGTRG